MTTRAQAPILPAIRPEIADLAPYVPGKPASALRRELGLERIVKLASNENPLGPSPKAIAALNAPGLWEKSHLYLDLHDLTRAAAAHAGVEPNRIVLGNGSDEIFTLLAEAYLREGDNIVTGCYEFARYRMCAQIMGADTIQVPLTPEWQLDVRAMAAAVNKKTRGIFLSNPINPVGSMVPHEDLVWLVENVRPDLLVVIDQAYHGYVKHLPGYRDCVYLQEKHPNVVVTRTFSKAYGLASLRAGFGVGSPEVVAAMERVRPPFNINKASLVAATAALADDDHVRRSVEVNEAGKRWLRGFLDEMGVEYVPPVANFSLLKVDRPCREFVDELMKLGVIVRPMHGYGLSHHVRVSIGLPEENAIFAEAFRQAWRG